jgi:hypothetical protein
MQDRDAENVEKKVANRVSPVGRALVHGVHQPIATRRSGFHFPTRAPIPRCGPHSADPGRTVGTLCDGSCAARGGHPAFPRSRVSSSQSCCASASVSSAPSGRVSTTMTGSALARSACSSHTHSRVLADLSRLAHASRRLVAVRLRSAPAGMLAEVVLACRGRLIRHT